MNACLELFLDSSRISWESNLARRLNQPVRHRGNPILVSEHPWEASYVTLYGSVLPHPQRGLRMWYMAGAGGMRGDQTLCCAHSDDGYTWHRLMQGRAYHSQEPTNIVLGPQPNVHGPCVIENRHNDDPAERYLLLYDSYARHHQASLPPVHESRNVHAAVSADGLRWTALAGPAIAGKSDVGQCVVWDPLTRRYIAYLRALYAPDASEDGPLGKTHRVRYVRAATSADFRSWSQPLELFRCDKDDGDPDSQAHQLSVTRWGDQYVGLLSIFRIDSRQPIPDQNLLIEEGVTDTQLMTSRDGFRWTRVAGRQTFFPLGLPDQWDSRWIVTASQIVEHDGLMLFYYGATHVDRTGLIRHHDSHGANKAYSYSIGVASLPRDRFQALHPDHPDQPAVFETIPLHLDPGDLQINADGRPGDVRVELRRFNGTTIDGFTRLDCEPLRTDSTSHTVRWRGGGLAVALRDPSIAPGAVRIRFYLNRASLYAMTVPLQRSGGDGA